MFEADFVEQRHRGLTFFRLILAIPLLIWGLVWWIGVAIVHIIAWFALLFTGRFPVGLYNFTASYLRFSSRVLGYLNLMTDAYPPFNGADDPSYPIRIQIAPPLPSYGRWRVFLHGPIAVLGLVVAYVAWGFLTIIAAAAGAPPVQWLMIVNDGRARRSLHRLSWLYAAWSVRIGAWWLLMVQDFPPFFSEWERTAA
jgi:hypothetical protein